LSKATVVVRRLGLMWSAVLLLGADATGSRPGPKTTGDYIVLYTGLGLVALAILYIAFRSWRNRRR
jgi:hypothetical protein